MSKPWLSSPVKENKDKKTKASKPPKFPIFTEASKLITDVYWKNIFEKCGVGKFPARFSFRDGFLYYKQGNRSQSIEIPRIPMDTVSLVINFFQTNSGLMSPDQIQESQRKQMLLAQSYRSPTSWKDLNLKERNLYVTCYIANVIKEMKLNHREQEQFRCMLKGGLAIGCFSNSKNNIVISQSQIVEIKGLYFDYESRRFYIDPSLYPPTNNIKYSTASNPGIEGGYSLEKGWDKYINAISGKKDPVDNDVDSESVID